MNQSHVLTRKVSNSSTPLTPPSPEETTGVYHLCGYSTFNSTHVVKICDNQTTTIMEIFSTKAVESDTTSPAVLPLTNTTVNDSVSLAFGIFSAPENVKLS